MFPDLTSWARSGLRVDDSPIAGRGLFTTVDIPARTEVIRFGGYFVPIAERYAYHAVQPGTTVGIADFVLLAEPVDGAKDPSDYINHSCRPTLGMADAVTMLALVDVPAGGELTADYAYWEADPGYQMRSRCECGAAGCRGRITGRDWQRYAEYPHLARWSSPFVRRKIHTLRHQRADETDQQRTREEAA